MIFKRSIFWIILYLSQLKIGAGETNVVVDTAYGPVKGILNTEKGVKIASFLGIPYAKPPIGSRRFTRPDSINPWKQTYDATRFQPECFTAHKKDTFNHSEDCLYMNIWAPRNGTSRLRPVLFYIHGGGFVDGTARIPGLLFSALSNAVVVSMNYRLNLFGFLNLYVEESPGNMGLLDQQLALEWINANIGYFGGDRYDITILGMSAGGASVGYHLLSPKSHNLFQRAAMHSGSPIDTWAFDTKDETLIKARELADLVRCNGSDATEDPKRLIKCLQNIPAKILNSKNVKIKLVRPMTFSFVPTVDNLFISDTPTELIRKGKFKITNIIIGTDKNDGGSFVPESFPEYFKHGFPTGSQIVDITKAMYPKLSKMQLTKVLNKYFKNLEDPLRRKNNTIEAGYMMGDTGFVCPSLFLAESMTAFGGKAFYYQFVHKKSGSESWIDVPHGVDLVYLFGTVQQSSYYTVPEKKLSERIVSQWVDFAKNGGTPRYFFLFLTINNNHWNFSFNFNSDSWHLRHSHGLYTPYIYVECITNVMNSIFAPFMTVDLYFRVYV
ncbi:Cholinesterase [Nymphon striatum]|nr:Cholinesterase [Nymphon striatum]